MSESLRAQVDEIIKRMHRPPATLTVTDGVPREGVDIDIELNALWDAIKLLADAIDAR